MAPYQKRFVLKFMEAVIPLVFTISLLSICWCEGRTETGVVNVPYVRSINKADEIVFRYTLSSNSKTVPDDHMKIKVFSKLLTDFGSVLKHPLLFTVRQQLAVNSWQLPVTWNNNTGFSIESYDQAEKTLCFNPLVTADKGGRDIEVVVYTRSERNITFSLNVTEHRDFTVEDGKNYTTILSPVASQFYFYKFTKPLQDFVRVKISSNDSVCMTVSIQSPTCPVFSSNQEFATRSGGFWETVSRNAGFSVRRSDFPNGFFIVFMVQKDDTRCAEYQGIVPNNGVDTLVQKNFRSTLSSPSSSLSHKSIQFEIRSQKEFASYWEPVLFPLLFYLLLVVTIFIVFIYFHHTKSNIVLAGDNPTSSSNLLENTDVEPKAKRWQSPVKIHDLVKMNITRLERKSERYCWSIIIVAIFYCLPVIQLTWTYVRVMLRTGDHDICYYNFLCAHPWGVLPVFNHLYSNAGYIILGVVFLLLVRIKQTHLKYIESDTKSINQPSSVNIRNSDSSDSYDEEKQSTKRVGFGKAATIESVPDEKDSVISKRRLADRIIPTIERSTDYGIFYHFGLFYAMGLALIMEGVMSAAYHICPTQINFQFDTAFMYIIVILCIVKLYQFRHPVYMNANVIFICLALVAIFVFFGLWSNGNPTIRVIFVLFHFFLIFNCLIFQYYVGYLRVNKEVITSLTEVYKYCFSKLRHAVIKRELKTFHRQTVVLTRRGEFKSYDFSVTRHRAILPALVILFNVFVTIVNFTVLKDDNFATQVLGILIVNLLAYLIYYCIMKYLHCEYKNRMWIQNLIYAVLSIALWAPSMRYFTMNLTSWDRPPAESRIQNQECFIMDFYDFHDFWHFLSAGGLFSSFMFLLTIDDDLIGRHKSEIPVF